jgi:hypothetical protein
MGHREKMIGGTEYDALPHRGFRRLLNWRSGLRRAIKAKFNRRVRKSAKKALGEY